MKFRVFVLSVMGLLTVIGPVRSVEAAAGPAAAVEGSSRPARAVTPAEPVKAPTPPPADFAGRKELVAYYARSARSRFDYEPRLGAQNRLTYRERMDLIEKYAVMDGECRADGLRAALGDALIPDALKFAGSSDTILLEPDRMRNPGATRPERIAANPRNIDAVKTLNERCSTDTLARLLREASGLHEAKARAETEQQAAETARQQRVEKERVERVRQAEEDAAWQAKKERVLDAAGRAAGWALDKVLPEKKCVGTFGQEVPCRH